MSDSEFAKVHLREHLSSLLIPHISEGFWSIYHSSHEVCQRNSQLDNTLRTFQNMLTKIPEWSDTVLSTEIDRIIKLTKCSYMDDLLMGVFLAYMKSFASLHYRGTSKEIKIDFERPSFAKFIHELYKHSARKLWQVAYLFKTIGVSSEQQARNRQDIEKHISDCMEQVIRSFLPWEAIAKQYFMQDQVSEPISEHVEPPHVVAHAEPDTGKSVSFNKEDSDSESEDESEHELKVSDETAELDIQALDIEKEDEQANIDVPTSDDTLVLS